MSFPNPIVITYNAVAKNLAFSWSDSKQSVYFLDDGTEKYTVTIKHTIPNDGDSGESHTARLDVAYYDADGVYLRKNSNWNVIKTFDNVQEIVTAQYCADAFEGFLTSTVMTDLLQRLR